MNYVTMKPPSRRRVLPSRFLPSKGTESTRMSFNGWREHEQRSLLRALRLQHRFNSELDLLELRKKVPKRTLLEIQNVINSLRIRVARRVHQRVHRQKCEERMTKAPIEIWAELAQKVTGVHEETISSAFSKMLVIAAIEPGNRLHSDLPRSFNTPSPVANTLHATPMTRKGKSSSPSCKNALQPSSVSGIEEASVCTQPSGEAGQDSGKPSTPSVPKTNICQLTSNKNHAVLKKTPPASTVRAVSSTAVSVSNQRDKHDEDGQSEHDHQPRSMDCVVDFEKIYKYLWNMNTKNYSLTLTAMESAVLLDLLMSLPEELPLLDCKELQHHLLQVHTHLSTPPVDGSSIPSTDQRPAAAKPTTASVTKKLTATVDHHAKSSDTSSQSGQTVRKNNRKGGDSNVVSKQGKAVELPLTDDSISNKSCTVNPTKDRNKWAGAGLCPLNPFMVPVGLLKQQQSQDSV